MDVRRLAREERADLAAFLATLSPQQWQGPTLCARWRVRDVVAHVISYDDLDTRGLAAYVIEGRFRPGRVNAAALAGYATRSPEQLLALLADHLQPRGLPAALGGRIALVEGLIHHQDIRRPLALPRAIPPERLLPALPCALIAPDVGGFWRIRGVRLIATDLGVSFGAGPGRYRYEVAADGITAAVPDGTIAYIPWPVVTAVRETRERFFLFGRQYKTMWVLPKRALSDHSSVQQLGEFLRASAT